MPLMIWLIMEAKMPERSMTETMKAVDGLLDDFDAICRSSFGKYRGYPPEILIEHDARAAANCVYAHMLADAERRLSVRTGVVFKDVRGLKLWLVDDAAVVRFKKMDEDGRSRNYPTKQAKDYDRGTTLPGLPPPAVRLSVGYLADPTATEVLRVQVARPQGRSIDWCAAIVPVGERIVGQPLWVDVTRQARGL